MSNIKGLPGYVPPPEPHKPRPMTPSGTVVPPKVIKSGKQRKAAKDEAERMVKATCLGNEWMVLGFRVNDQTGEVELVYKIEGFPGDRFQEAADLFAMALTKIAASHPDVRAALAASAAKNSEPGSPSSPSSESSQTSPNSENPDNSEIPPVLPL